MVTTKISDMIVITIGIVVLAILFWPYFAISISLIKSPCVRLTILTRKLKISYDILYRNFRRSGKYRFDQNATRLVFIPAFGIFNIVSLTNLLGMHFPTFSLLGIPLLQNRGMMAVL